MRALWTTPIGDTITAPTFATARDRSSRTFSGGIAMSFPQEIAAFLVAREEKHWETLLPDDIRAIRRAAQGPLPDDATPAEKHWRKMFEQNPKKYRKERWKIESKFKRSFGPRGGKRRRERYSRPEGGTL